MARDNTVHHHTHTAGKQYKKRREGKLMKTATGTHANAMILRPLLVTLCLLFLAHAHETDKKLEEPLIYIDENGDGGIIIDAGEGVYIKQGPDGKSSTIIVPKQKGAIPFITK